MARAVKRLWSGEGGGREVMVLSLPLVLSTSSWTIQHFVDRMFLAWYSPAAIAAAMPAGILNFALMSLFIGTAGYVSTFVAQYSGAGMEKRVGPTIWQGIYFSLIGGVVLGLMVVPADAVFSWVGHEEQVRINEVAYFRYLCAGAFPAIMASALSGFFTGLGKTVHVMVVTLFATAVNLVLDYALIFGALGMPKMGIRGAALATVASGVFSSAAYVALMFQKRYRLRYATVSGWRLDIELFGRLVRYGLPSGVQFFLDMAGFTAFVLLVGRLGTIPLAATNIAFNINSIAFMPMIGVGMAVSVLVGRYIGRGDPGLASRSAYSGLFITCAYMGTVSVMYVLVPSLFTLPFAAGADAGSFADIRHLAEILLRFVALYSLFDTLNVVFASALKGAGDTRFVMYAIVALSVLVLVIPTWLAVIVLGMGIYAAWTAATVYVIALGFVFYIRFLQGRWRSMKVIEEPRPIHSLPATSPECPDVKFDQ